MFAPLRATCAVVLLGLGLGACQTITPAAPPPLPGEPGGASLSGPAPRAALLPWYSKNTAVAAHAYDALTACLADRNVFAFVPRTQVEAAVAAEGVDLERTFGPDDADFAAIARRTEADYVMGGALTVMKDLTLFGWRRDITLDMRLHAADGSEVDYWRENTAITFAEAKTFTDGKAMADSTVNHLCGRMLEQAAG